MNKTTLYATLVKGWETQKKAHDQKEEAALHTLRGGNSGCKVGDIIFGADPREVVLRYFGISTATSFDDQLGFDAGFANEDI